MNITVTVTNHSGAFGGRYTPDVVSGYAVEIADAPALTGSAKQVAWAESIRAAAIEDAVRAVLRNARADDRSMEQARFLSPALVEQLASVNRGAAKMADALAEFTAAKDWIDAAGGDRTILTVRALMSRKAA